MAAAGFVAEMLWVALVGCLFLYIGLENTIQQCLFVGD